MRVSVSKSCGGRGGSAADNRLYLRHIVLTAVVPRTAFYAAKSDAKDYEEADHKRVLQCKAPKAYEEFPKGGEEAAGGYLFS